MNIKMNSWHYRLFSKWRDEKREDHTTAITTCSYLRVVLPAMFFYGIVMPALVGAVLVIAGLMVHDTVSNGTLLPLGMLTAPIAFIWGSISLTEKFPRTMKVIGTMLKTAIVLFALAFLGLMLWKATLATLAGLAFIGGLMLLIAYWGRMSDFMADLRLFRTLKDRFCTRVQLVG